MKKTGINKDGWEVKKLGEVCTGKGEYGSGSSAIAFDKSKPRYIRITDIKENGELNDEKVSPSGSDFDEYELSEGDILFARSGATVGKTYIHSEKNGYCIYAGYLIRFVVDRKVMLPKFLFHYTRSAFYNDWIKSQQRVVAQPNINAKQYGDLPIIVPPLPAQSAIVAELDSLHRLKGLQEQQLEEYDKLAQATFYSMFGDPIENNMGWKVKTIENICSSLVRGPFGSALKKEFFVPKSESTYKIYEQKNAIQNDATLGNYYIDSDRYNSLTRFTVMSNDIIMSCSGTIGKLLVIPENADRGIINQALLKFTLNKSVEIEYFKFLMDRLVNQLDSKGSGIKNLGSVNYIKKLSFGLPSLSLQTQFAQRIEKIESQKELVKQSIAQTEQLINYTMDKYFG